MVLFSGGVNQRLFPSGLLRRYLIYNDIPLHLSQRIIRFLQHGLLGIIFVPSFLVWHVSIDLKELIFISMIHRVWWHGWNQVFCILNLTDVSSGSHFAPKGLGFFWRNNMGWSIIFRCFCFFTFFFKYQTKIQLLFAPPPKKNGFFQKRQEFFRSSHLLFWLESQLRSPLIQRRKPFPRYRIRNEALSAGSHLPILDLLSQSLQGSARFSGGRLLLLTIDWRKKPQVLAARSWKNMCVHFCFPTSEKLMLKIPKSIMRWPTQLDMFDCLNLFLGGGITLRYVPTSIGSTYHPECLGCPLL